MNLYGLDYSLFDLGLADPTLMESLSSSQQQHMIIDRRHRQREEEDLIKLSNSILKNINSPSSNRHDGTSPLPLGMDWSPPPRKWDGPNTIWPHDFHTGWSYCVTVPSWSVLSESGSSEPIVFYRVQVGLQSPEGVTTTRGVLRRFSDFSKLSSDLKRSFSKKKLPPAPPKGLLRTKSNTVLEERRCALEGWMEKVLSDMDFSRSAPIACFLELEAAARLSFAESSSYQEPNVNLSSNSACLSDPSHDNSPQKDTSCAAPSETSNSSKCSEGLEASEALDEHASSHLQISHDTTDEQQKLNRLLTTKTDMEDLTERLNQELVVREYLITKVKDLENELESMEELTRKCVEMESRLKAEQDEKAQAEATKISMIQENEALRQELNSAQEQLKNLHKSHEVTNLKLKSDAKLLVKEVKSLRNSQVELKQELDRVAKERTEFETRLQKERTEREHINTANAKLLHECEILRGRLQECNVDFVVEEENKLNIDASSSPSDALDISATSENRNDLLAEAQLLVQDVATPVTNASS